MHANGMFQRATDTCAQTRGLLVLEPQACLHTEDRLVHSSDQSREGASLPSVQDRGCLPTLWGHSFAPSHPVSNPWAAQSTYPHTQTHALISHARARAPINCHVISPTVPAINRQIVDAKHHPVCGAAPLKWR
uniref:Uncharacterized protein n=1 Tax=Eutreptiella gymnastica TaxID=73025 RepID=A0A7S1IGW6_9EUGL